jgi:small-conductance mechanosensitive channel
LISDLANRTKFLFLLLLGIYVGSLSLSLPEHWNLIIGTVIIIGLWLQAGFWGTGLVRYFISTRLRQEQEEQDAAAATTVSALGAAASVVLWALVLLMALDNIPGVEVTALLASLGVGGVAVALALQNILGDLFASLAIALDRPFVIGDFIIIDDYMGTVERIGLKTTRLRSLSGEQIVFSNSDLLNSRVRNYKVMFERRVVFKFGILYETPLEKVRQVGGMVEDIIHHLVKARFDRAHFASFGQSSLDFEVVYYVLDPDYNLYMDIQQSINLQLMERFQREGIEFAYPTQTVYLAQPSQAPPNSSTASA